VGLPEAEETPGSSAGNYVVGSMVEYHSASQGNWIVAKVIRDRGDGTYDLDCKPAVPSAKIRPAQGAVPVQSGAVGSGEGIPDFEIGAVVEYYSESQMQWILAKVKSYSPETGRYTLDCKPNVPANRIRAFGSGKASTLETIPEARGSPLPGAALPAAPELDMGDVLSRTAPNARPHTSSFAGGSSGSTAPPPKQTEPLQLVSVARDGSRWKFTVLEEGLRMLEAYGQRQVSVCTVCGPYRTGKSYLLNLLLGTIQRGEKQFQVGSTTRACTEGIWMWGSSESLNDGNTMLFIDCEGFGSTDSDKARDSKLMSLCILLSSVFLLNTKGVLNEGLFNSLSFVCNLTEHIEEKGQQTSRPALLWCLRDFVLQLEDESGEAITADQYLEQSLHARPTVRGDSDRGRAAKEVRECLVKFFPQRNCSTLVMPIVDEEKLGSLASVPYQELRMEFRNAFEAMRQQLFDVAQQRPKTVGGQLMGGAALAAMLRKMVDAMNSDKALNMVNAWDGVQHTACSSLVDNLRREALAEIAKIKQGAPLPTSGRPLPASDAALLRSCKASRRALRDRWDLEALGDPAVQAEYWRELKQAVVEEQGTLEQLNNRLAEDQLRSAVDEWKSWLRNDPGSNSLAQFPEALTRLLDSGMPSAPAARATKEVLQGVQAAWSEWKNGLQSAKSELERSKVDLEGLHSAKAELERSRADLEERDRERSSNVAASQQNASKEAAEEAANRAREVGRLEGQIEILENRVKEATRNEEALKEKLQAAENQNKADKAALQEAMRTCAELEQRATTLQDEIDAKKRADKPDTIINLKENDENLKPNKIVEATKESAQPKKCCAIM